MKFLLQTIAIAVTACILEIFLPWYSLAVAAFVFGFALKTKANFLAGFIAIAGLWAVRIWLLTSASSSDLPARVAQLFTLPKNEYLVLVSIAIGGLVGGFAALTGAILRPRKREPYYIPRTNRLY
jgi:hypothetical protein